MQVEGAEPRSLQHLQREDLAVGDHHGGVQLQGLKGGDLLRIPHRAGGAHRQVQRLGESLHRRGPQLLPATARRRRLGVHRRDLVAGGDEFRQGFHRELRRAEEGQTHGRGLAAPGGCANLLTSARAVGVENRASELARGGGAAYLR